MNEPGPKDSVILNMKIFSAGQTRRRDLQTLHEQGIASEVLMERAASRCSEWILDMFSDRSFIIFCGPGNNGGDGLAIARLLHEKGKSIQIYITENAGKKGSPDFELNLTRAKERSIPLHILSDERNFPVSEKSDIIIDALFGSGLSKPLSGMAAALTEHINEQSCPVVSIDIPSGVFCDSSSKGCPAIRATHTLSFSRKLAFMMAENEFLTGQIHYLDIGLSKQFEQSEFSPMIIVQPEEIRKMIRKRPLFAHKGDFGHGALVAGSHGMMGAAILAAAAFLRSGAGKLTCYVPRCGYEIMQTSVPEAMCETSGDDTISPFTVKSGFNAVGAGPGLGAGAASKELLSPLLQAGSALVLDADALNGIAASKELLDQLPANTILTPHPGEFERIFGKTENDFARLEKAMAASAKHKIFIILKGHHTATCTPEGNVFFNDSGNPGMAKPGMGDVLTGLITGLLAQSYSPEQACLLGVYVHGRAGDLAARQHTQQAMTAMQLVDKIEEVWKELI